MYFPFILLYAKGMGTQIVNAIAGMELLPPNHHWPQKRIEINGYEFMFRKFAELSIPAQPSHGSDGKWAAAFLQPIGLDRSVGPYVFRRFRRWVLNQTTGYLLGPYSIQRVAQLRPSFADRYLKPGIYDVSGNYLGPVPGSKLLAPWVWMGDPKAELIAQIDYQPSDQDCIDDIEPNLEQIFGE